MGGKSRSNGESTLSKAKKRKNSKDDTRQTIRQKRKRTGKKEMMVNFAEKPSSYKEMAAGNVIKRKGSLSEQNGETPTETNSSILTKLKEKEERENIVLWRHPLTTLQYFSLEAAFLLKNNGMKLWHHRQYVLIAVLFSALTLLAYHSKGSHQKYVQFLQSKFMWCSYWIGLGVLSSVGFGTGLHTFILYLGPHIASVTLAAYECGSLDFPEPPYPDEIICPENGIVKKSITVWDIMSKVRLEAFMWGAGTALGELPPYFMAKASRLSGYDPDEDHEDFDQLLQQNSVNSDDQSYLDRARIVVEKLVEKVGFFGILACASIPNPLFDLAGITCGHFLVPFWTFFGATLIGKAIVKMHIQKLFVIIAFNEEMLAKAVDLIRFVPYVGKYLQAPFKEFLVKQKAKLHKRAHSENSWLAWIFEKFVISMIAYFVVSIINSLAQSYHKRINKNKSSSSQVKIAKD